MSANLDLVRSSYAALEQGDWSFNEWTDPEMEYVFVDGPSPARYKGRARAAEGLRDFLGAWQGLRLEVDEYRELDDERLLVLGHFAGRGKTSGIELGAIATQWANVVDIRDGLVKRVVAYFDRDRAFADLGLEG